MNRELSIDLILQIGLMTVLYYFGGLFPSTVVFGITVLLNLVLIVYNEAFHTLGKQFMPMLDRILHNAHYNRVYALKELAIRVVCGIVILSVLVYTTK